MNNPVTKDDAQQIVCDENVSKNMEEILEDIERLYLDRPRKSDIIRIGGPSEVVFQGIGSIKIKKTRPWGAYVIAMGKHHTRIRTGAIRRNKYILASRATNIEFRTSGSVGVANGYYGSEMGVSADVELRLDFSQPYRVKICNPDGRCYIELSGYQIKM